MCGIPYHSVNQWNLSNTDTIGTKIIVLISEVSLFKGENNMYLYKVGTQSSVLIKQGVLISEVSFKRGSTVCQSRSLLVMYVPVAVQVVVHKADKSVFNEVFQKPSVEPFQ